MEYYHLVTRKPMYVGQQIILEKGRKNNLYSFFLDNNFKNTSDESWDQIIQRLDTTLDYEECLLLKNAMSHTSRAIREVVTEMVRLDSFPMLPSRLKCLYRAENIEDLIVLTVNYQKY